MSFSEHVGDKPQLISGDGGVVAPRNTIREFDVIQAAVPERRTPPGARTAVEVRARSAGRDTRARVRRLVSPRHHRHAGTRARWR